MAAAAGPPAPLPALLLDGIPVAHGHDIASRHRRCRRPPRCRKTCAAASRAVLGLPRWPTIAAAVGLPFIRSGTEKGSVSWRSNRDAVWVRQPAALPIGRGGGDQVRRPSPISVPEPKQLDCRFFVPGQLCRKRSNESVGWNAVTARHASDAGAFTGSSRGRGLVGNDGRKIARIAQGDRWPAR